MEKLKDHKLYIATTAKKGIRTLKMMRRKKIPIDYIFLDHDLDGSDWMDSDNPRCGIVVAKFIRDSGIACPIIIHSQNYLGAIEMNKVLPQATRIPFYELREKFFNL